MTENWFKNLRNQVTHRLKIVIWCVDALKMRVSVRAQIQDRKKNLQHYDKSCVELGVFVFKEPRKEWFVTQNELHKKNSEPNELKTKR